MSLLRHRTARFLIVVVLVWVAWETYIAVSARHRLDPALARELDRGGLVNVTVTLPFAPEDFHIRIFQTHGIVSGVKGTDRQTSGRLRYASADSERGGRLQLEGGLRLGEDRSIVVLAGIGARDTDLLRSAGSSML